MMTFKCFNSQWQWKLIPRNRHLVDIVLFRVLKNYMIRGIIIMFSKTIYCLELFMLPQPDLFFHLC